MVSLVGEAEIRVGVGVEQGEEEEVVVVLPGERVVVGMEDLDLDLGGCGGEGDGFAVTEGNGKDDGIAMRA